MVIAQTDLPSTDLPPKDLPPKDLPPCFDEAFKAQLHDLLVWRRDVRRFKRDAMPEGTLERLIETACLAPSVGLSQPWRFVVVDDAKLRGAVLGEFERCNADALQSYSGETAARYAKLKLAGLTDAPGHLAIFADRTTIVGRGLGRRTMPEMADYSVVAAIVTMWLAARAEGIGMGWVSILDPARLAQLLGVPGAWRFIGYFCLGFPEAEDRVPELERTGWEKRVECREHILRR
jgi:5,6-dimethylbenzimidazole synthase